MKTLLTITLSTIAFSLFSQNNVRIEINPSTNENCANVSLISDEENEIYLRGQVYRLYYDDAKLNLQDIHMLDELANLNYQANIQIHKNGMSKEIDGGIEFEKNMGFLSISVMPSNDVTHPIELSLTNHIRVLDVCFDNKISATDVALATQQTTRQYAKSFSSVYYDIVQPTLKNSMLTYSEVSHSEIDK